MLNLRLLRRVLCALAACAIHPAGSLRLPPPPRSTTELGRRAATGLLGAAATAAALPVPAARAAGAASEEALLKELQTSRAALEPLPALLDEEKWDAVRSVLKVPPVGNLWNLGETKNPMRKFADLRDDVELFELADEISGALQLADQYSYSNTFIYTQPGNGKVKIKEPKQQIKIASDKLGELIGK